MREEEGRVSIYVVMTYVEGGGGQTFGGRRGEGRGGLVRYGFIFILDFV